LGIIILPATTLGKWSIGSSIGVFIFLFLNPLIISLSNLIVGKDLSGNQYLLSMIGALLVGFSTAAFVTGVISMIKFKERSILVILATLFNFVYLMFALDTIFIQG
jgi:hypothetical protein